MKSHHSPLSRRASGILLHPTSLPGPYGIGDLGPAARRFVDRLASARQSWWQMLPLNPPAAGNSPYQCDSAFAGNPLLISPEDLASHGHLPRVPHPLLTASPSRIDFPRVTAFKNDILAQAWHQFQQSATPQQRSAFRRFRIRQRSWLKEYALFAALSEHYHTRAWPEWPRPLALRQPDALAKARLDHAAVIDYHAFLQFLFDRQLAALHVYARSRGIHFLADLPIFVSAHSADVWAHPSLFLLNARGYPRVVAGVPPDAFSSTGQRWGNPLYNWPAMRRDRFAWWIARLQSVLYHADAVRVDHFRGFSACWQISARCPTAIRGRWVPAAGAQLLDALHTALGALPLVAEDLGIITPDVERLRDRFALPGMRVLQFAFDGNPDNPHLPFNHPAAAVVYTGTHDNPTTRAWFDRLTSLERQHLCTLLPDAAHNSGRALLRAAWLSPARTAIAPLQDILNLGAEARMNTPGRVHGNWQWRWASTGTHEQTFSWLGNLTQATRRAAPAPQKWAT